MGLCFSIEEKSIEPTGTTSNRSGSKVNEGRTGSGSQSQPGSGKQNGSGKKESNKRQSLSIVDVDVTNLRQFSYDELVKATRKFSSEAKLGEGGFGGVFKASIESVEEGGRKMEEVAVKVMDRSGGQGEQEWLSEVIYLGRLNHPNLVRLVGFCMEGRNRLLVYEFLSKGSFESHLFNDNPREAVAWNTRMKVARDAAKGLACLHEAKIIYRDFKASNILLDENFNAKLSDFGLAKDGPVGENTHVSTRVMGTYGYAAPEYLSTGHLTSKSDIYAFGVVLLEILAGRRAMESSRPKDEEKIVDWSRPFFADKEKLLSMLDPRLKGRFSKEGAMRVAILARRCVRMNPLERPAIGDIVKILDDPKLFLPEQ